jgi:pimeloyl-ACP methyl ester carboxylesterase
MDPVATVFQVFLSKSMSGSNVNAPPLHYVKTTDNLHISYFTIGEGPALVFASNIFGDAHMYCQLARHHVRGVTNGLVALGWNVIRHDVRGMGSSDRAVDDFSLQARVSDLEAVVDGLGLERFALAGVDIGAATAIAFAARNAHRVSRLVLLSPWVSGADMFARCSRHAIGSIHAAKQPHPSAWRDITKHQKASI